MFVVLKVNARFDHQAVDPTPEPPAPFRPNLFCLMFLLFRPLSLPLSLVKVFGLSNTAGPMITAGDGRTRERR